MKCSYCGVMNYNKGSCIKCGAPLPEEKITEPFLETIKLYEEKNIPINKSSKKENKDKSGWGFLYIILLFVALPAIITGDIMMSIYLMVGILLLFIFIALPVWYFFRD